MIFVIFNNKLNRDESYPFNTKNSNDMDDFKGWDEELKNNPELTIKVIEK